MSRCTGCQGTMVPLKESSANSTATPISVTARDCDGGTDDYLIENIDIIESHLPDISQVVNAEKCNTDTPVEPECDDCAQPEEEIRCETPKRKESKPCPPWCYPLDWLKSKPVQCMKLFGYAGRAMARLTGSGYLFQKDCGEVELHENPPIKSTKLLHDFNRSSINESALIGDPLPADYDVVTLEDGSHYLQRGLPNSKSIKVWHPELGKHIHVALGQLGNCVGSQLPSNTQLELVGLRPLGPSEPVDTERCFEKLMGEGMLIAKKVPTAVTQLCKCEDCGVQDTVQAETTVFEFVPCPSDCDTATYVWTCGTNGSSWQKPTDVEGLKGETGETGETGPEGPEGPKGDTGLRGGVMCDTDCDIEEPVVDPTVDPTADPDE